MDIRNKAKNQNQNKISRAEKVFALENNQKEKFELKKKLEKFKLFLSVNFKKIKISSKDHWHLLIKSAAQNHLRIQECKNIKKGDVCNLEFGSYSELKRYQKKVRLFTYSFSSTMVSVAIAIVAVQMFFGTGSSQGATFTFFQDDWNTASTTLKADHIDNKTGWTNYHSKDADISGGTTVQMTLKTGQTIGQNQSTFDAGSTKTNTLVSGGGVELQKTETANSWATMASMPGGMRGSFLAYDNNGNVFALRGGNTSDFWKYNIASNVWTSLASTPSTVNSDSSGLVYDGSGNIFALRGGNTANFWRYNIETNTWIAKADFPLATSFRGAMAHDANGNIFAINYGNAFYKYDIALNSWTAMANSLTNSSGGNLVSDQNGGIFLVNGNGQTGFSRYDIASNTWLAKAASPLGTFLGGTGSDGAGNIYVLRGNGFDNFWKYNIANNSWTTIASAPATVSSSATTGGGGMVFDGKGNFYAARGNNFTDFWKYSIYDNYASSGIFESSTIDLSQKGNLTALNFNHTLNGADSKYQIATSDSSGGPWNYVGPDGTASTYFTVSGTATPNLGFHRYARYKAFLTGGGVNTWEAKANTLANNTSGADIVHDSNGNIYSLAGGSSTAFSKYNTLTNSWSAMSPVPVTMTGVLASGYDGNLYAIRGGQTSDFYKYNILSNSWTQLTSAPVPMGSSAYSGISLTAGRDGNLYAIRGAGTGEFYRYNIALNSWSSLASYPSILYYGSHATTYGGDGNIYLLSASAFYKYNITLNNWTALANPLNLNGSIGEGLTSDSSGNIYFFNGNGSSLFYKYNISSATWTQIAATPANGSYGASLTSDTAGSMYAIRGNGTATFWKYSTRVTSTPVLSDITFVYSTYPTTQNLISSWYDTTDPANNFKSVIWDEASVPAGTQVKMMVQTAPDSAGSPGTPTGFVGIDPAGQQDGATYFTSTSFGCSKTGTLVTCDIPSGVPISTYDSSTPETAALTSDRWMQYRITLDSDGASTSQVNSASLKYVVNAAPQIQDVISSQGSDGKVTTTFNVIDLDTSTGRTANTVLGGFQYCTANCTNPGSETWVNATSLTYKDSINNILGNNILTVQELTLTSYTVIWDSKSDYDEQYNGSFKVRILANDSEDANNIGYGISNAFEFDTKDPINLSFTIDHTKSTNNLTLVAPSDDLPYQVAYSNYSDFRDAVFEDYPVDNKKTYPAIIDNDPATVYVRARDVKGNYMDATATTPASPSSVVYYDTSNDVSGEYREFIAWDVISAGQSGAGFGSYEIYRAERLESDQNATLNYLGVESIPDPNTNFYNDFNLDTNKHYYYKILTTDSAGNLSKYSSAVDDNPNGQGGSDQTPPTISNVRSTSINTTSATILWDTDEPANSSVGYSSQVDCDDAPGNLCPYLPERGIAAMVEKYTEGDPSKPGHSITLTGLIPGTTYNIRVKSYDVVGNLGQNDKDNNGASAIENFTFNTLPGPAISGVTIPNVSNTQATINWKTTTDSSSFVVYSTDISNGNLVNPKEFGTPELVGNPTSGEYYHSQTITTYNDLPLVPNETYYFYVKSIDGDGNEAVDNNGGSFYELTTTEDNKKPEIALIEIPVISNEGGVITWTTDEPATSKVSYGTTEGGPYPDHQEVVTFNRGHYIILSGLAADEDYYFKVESMDINGNVNDDTAEYNFKTTKNIEFDHPPLSKIENMDVTAENTRDTNAIITFTTDQPALCYAETDAVIVGSATTVTSFENGYTEDKNYNTSHSILVSSLTPESKYLYDVSCHDNILTVGMEDESDKFDKFENWIYSEIGDFETTKQRFALDELDINSPVINNVKVASTTGESATITWNTDEVGSSSVGYGITATNENGANDQIVNENKEKFATSHLVTLSGLIPSTKYLFRVSSTDKSGNIGFSAESSFTTASPSSLSSIKAESLNLGEAQITWNTSSETSSIVEYGLTTSYGEKKESNTLTKEHSISLSNLNQGVTYHFRVKGQDKDKKLYSSSDQTFEPKSPAQVSNININDITEHEATISFNTNIPTTATVIYTNISDPADNGSQADNEMATKHSIQIKNLTQGATFKIQIQARDEQGTESQTDAKDLTTGKDENPPKIDMVKTDLALAQNDKVQAIISWNTDEQSTTSVLYKEGRNAEAKEINISEALSTNHVAVITSFKPGTVYYFNTKSVDASGNEAKSTDYALLTPRRKENIIQIIIGNFTDIFGWAKF